MEYVHPTLIRRSRAEIKTERIETKMRLRAELSEHGDIAHIHKLMNKQGKISYTSVINTLNPNSSTWSPRVIEFAEGYVATKKSLGSTQPQS